MKKLLLFGVLGVTALNLFAGPARIIIQADKPGHAVSPHLWGIFFEDINLSADGGVYPELVRNRSFEDSEQPEHWRLIGAGDNQSELATDTTHPLNPLNLRSLRLSLIHISEPTRLLSISYAV